MLHGLRAVQADGALLEDVLQELGPLRQTEDRERDIIGRHLLVIKWGPPEMTDLLKCRYLLFLLREQSLKTFLKR